MHIMHMLGIISLVFFVGMFLPLSLTPGEKTVIMQMITPIIHAFSWTDKYNHEIMRLKYEKIPDFIPDFGIDFVAGQRTGVGHR